MRLSSGCRIEFTQKPKQNKNQTKTKHAHRTHDKNAIYFFRFDCFDREKNSFYIFRVQLNRQPKNENSVCVDGKHNVIRGDTQTNTLCDLPTAIRQTSANDLWMRKFTIQLINITVCLCRCCCVHPHAIECIWVLNTHQLM